MIYNKSKLSLSKRIASLRILFGLVWVVDAIFKFEPAFYKGNSLSYFVLAKDSGEPSWLNPWFHFWFRIFGAHPELFAIVILVIESLIALSLVLGIARRLNYALSVPFCFLIWGIGEAFGGPYVAGTTDINAGFIYLIVFLLLYAFDGLAKPSWSLDPWLSAHIKWWSKIANPPNLLAAPPNKVLKKKSA
jgi:thiosulfate dehydrogenase [quinone] large subunit